MIQLQEDRPDSTEARSTIECREWAGPGWKFTADSEGIRLETAGGDTSIPSIDVSTVVVSRSLFGLGRARLRIPAQGLRVPLPRLSRRSEQEIRTLLLELELLSTLRWKAELDSLIHIASTEQRWITRDQRSELNERRPPVLRPRRDHRRAFPGLTAQVEEANTIDVDAAAARLNAVTLPQEKATKSQFLGSIEKSPLTGEQIDAVLRYDNRVQVVAAAGSGKTSVMVARAAYAVDKGLTSPDRVLLLAFHRSAATELQERIDQRFESADLDASGVQASTFHSLGLRTIGAARGKKPKLAPWIANDKDREKVASIVDGLRDSSTEYRYLWDLYRLIYARAPISSPTDGNPDGWDADKRINGFETLNGEIVRSFGEKMIADWLFVNGVNYEYERAYEHPTATASYSQYHPDFYYPDIDAWHEHWAIGPDGKPPAEFQGYEDGMRWKRRTHASNGSDLIETTWHEIVNERSFERLRVELEQRGLELDWNPDKVPTTAKVATHDDMFRLMRTFMAHVKSNSYTRQHLIGHLKADQSRLNGERTRMFLDLYWPIHDDWNAALTDGGYVDFEDMLVQAADHLERNEVDLGYDLILVDEFQDTSRARIRLVAGLANKPHRHVLAVGDDWQSINRFAGADISAMTEFGEWFGEYDQLQLTRTFRFEQDLADVSSTFIQVNPRQIRKTVAAQRSPNHTDGAVELRYAQSGSQDLSEHINEVVKSAGEESVFILGRYGFDRDLVPSAVLGLPNVTFSTIHSSKGLEADHVIVPNLTVGTYGFPSEIADDPVLDLAMIRPDPFPHAEERRLLYVAMTRARKRVTLIANGMRPSPFIVELVDKGLVVAPDGQAIHVCQACSQGSMVPRTGPSGTFYGCSRFPACASTAQTVDGRSNPPRPTQDRGSRRCERCASPLEQRTGKFGAFYGCTTYPKCGYTENP